MPSIQDLIDKELNNKSKERNKDYKQTSWHASSIGNCLRGQYIQRLGVIKEELIDSRSLRVFSVGNQMEDWVCEIIKKHPKISVDTQVRVEDKELGISGYADAVIENGVKRVYELKTKHSRAFWYMQKEGKAMRQHEYQLWLYLKILDIPEGIIAYISKDDLVIAEYVVELKDEVLGKEVLARVNLLNKAWRDKDITLLPLEEEGSWQNKFCRFHKYCVEPELLNNIKKDVVS